MALTETDIQRQKEIQQAEELLFSGRQELGFAKGLFLGDFVADWAMPYPRLTDTQQADVDRSVTELRTFLDEHLDPEEIDRQADIPRHVIDGLGRVGVLGMTAPKEVGGRGFSQMQYCKVLEEIGGRCASTAVFTNAHHSIGIRALLLFGTKEQKEKWLPRLMNGDQLAAFALTEREAGSDAANVQMNAEPSEDGSHYILNGEKRYITNASIAQVLTVMARTPDPKKPGKTAITAFLVTPDMEGFEMIEARMPKLGIRGTATGRFRLNNVRVPKENILGPLGKGLRVALTVLDFGRTTFGACCTGGAKTCLAMAVEHANTRQQFNKTLGNFDLVKKKIARMAADVYAMEAMTQVTASLIDRGLEDYMLETAMLKVFTTERLWDAVNDCFQIHGGSAYFDDSPLGRILRDARINQIGEGSNEVLDLIYRARWDARAGHGVQGNLRHDAEAVAAGRRESRLGRGAEAASVGGQGARRSGAQRSAEDLREPARASRLAFQFRGRQGPHRLSRAGHGDAIDSRADRQCGDGIIRRHLCAEPLGFRVDGGRPQWPRERRSHRGGSFR